MKWLAILGGIFVLFMAVAMGLGLVAQAATSEDREKIDAAVANVERTLREELKLEVKVTYAFQSSFVTGQKTAEVQVFFPFIPPTADAQAIYIRAYELCRSIPYMATVTGMSVDPRTKQPYQVQLRPNLVAGERPGAPPPPQGP